VTTAILALAVLYSFGALFWTVYWAAEWNFGEQAGAPEAAWNALAAPIWPLPALKAAARLYAQLRHDARGHE